MISSEIYVQMFTHSSNPQQCKINGFYYAIDGMVQLQVSSSNIIETSWDNTESSEGHTYIHSTARATTVQCPVFVLIEGRGEEWV